MINCAKCGLDLMGYTTCQGCGRINDRRKVMGIEDVVCPECKRPVSTLEIGPSGLCLCCEENARHDRFLDERVRERQVDEGN